MAWDRENPELALLRKLVSTLLPGMLRAVAIFLSTLVWPALIAGRVTGSAPGKDGAAAADAVRGKWSRYPPIRAACPCLRH